RKKHSLSIQRDMLISVMRLIRLHSDTEKWQFLYHLAVLHLQVRFHVELLAIGQQHPRKAMKPLQSPALQLQANLLLVLLKATDGSIRIHRAYPRYQKLNKVRLHNIPADT